MADPLDRFVTAQDGTYATAMAEVRAGRKRSHWMWFIFPQLAVLGRSETAKYYGIDGLAEARAYLTHPVLGPRLREITQAVLDHAGTPPEAIFGEVDALKLRSCMSLFDRAGGGEIFSAVLKRFFDKKACPMTLAAL